MDFRKRWFAIVFITLVLCLAGFKQARNFILPREVMAQENSASEGDVPPFEEEEKAPNWFLDMTDKGGPAMYGIYACAIIGLAITIERTMKLRIKKIFPAAFIEQVREHLRERNIPEVITLCEGKKFPLARIVRAGLLQYNNGIQEVERAIEGASGLEIAILGSHMRTLGTLGNIATMLGLLGTVTGMISAFQTIASAGTGRPDLVARGISEAMTTTAAGLIAAIPLVLLYSHLMGKIDNIVIELEEISLDLIEELTFGGIIEE